MEDKRITMKEIAKLAGVSIGTVHSALYGKPGIKEETRQRVIQVAKENHYQQNTMAAALKRKPVSVVVAIPALSSVNRYYFNNLWAALNNYKGTYKDFNVSFIEIPYYINDTLLENEFVRLYDDDSVSGIIGFAGYMDPSIKSIFQEFSDRGKAVVLVGEDWEPSNRLCCVLPNYEMTGKMVAELIGGRIRENAKILICAGDVTIFSHYRIVEGFCGYIEENGLNHQVLRKHYSHNMDDYYRSLVEVLTHEEEISACFAVTARESVLLGKALEETGRAGRIVTVGSDIFEENMEFLENGVFTNLLNKNPYMQMLVALRCMVNYLVKDEKPVKKLIYVGTEIVFKSSLSMYKQGEADRLLL